MKKKLLAVIFVGLLLSACAGAATVKLQPQALSTLSGSTLHIKREKPDPFLPMSSSKGALGVLGVAAAVAEGKELIRKFSLKDPSHKLEDQLSNYVIGKYKLAGRGQVLDFVNHSAPSDIVGWAQKNKVQGLLLDVETMGWTYMQDGFNYSLYWVGYNAKMRLTDLSSGKVISSHMCVKNTKEDMNGQTFPQDKLLASSGALLKKLFSQLSDACLQEFKAKAL